MVFSCCQFCPNKAAIESLIKLAKKEESEEKVVERILEFENHEGFNCLDIIFDMGKKYRNKTDDYLSGPLLVEIEESCQYLVQLAKFANLDLDRILNHTTKRGDTLFSDASIYSEKITKELLMETNDQGMKIVNVNSIDDLFVTPFFNWGY